MDNDYFIFFVNYLQNHVYFNPKHIVEDYLSNNGFSNLKPHELSVIISKGVRQQKRLIITAKALGYITNFSKKTYKHTKKVQDPGPLIKELKKIKFSKMTF